MIGMMLSQKAVIASVTMIIMIASNSDIDSIDNDATIVYVESVLIYTGVDH